MNSAQIVTAERDARAVRSIGTQFFANGAVVASYIPRLPEIREHLGASLTSIGSALAFASIGGILGGALVGRATESFSTKKVMLIGATAILFLLPLVGVVAEVWQFLIVLGLIQAADVFTDVAMNVQGSALSARRDKPVMNRLHGLWSLGTVVGGLIAAGMAAADVSLRVHLVLAAIVLGVTLMYVAPGLLTENDRPPQTASASSRSMIRGVWIFSFLGAAAILPEMINSDWAAFRSTVDLDASDGVAGLAYVAFTIGMVIGRLNGDAVVQRVGSIVLLRYATLVAGVGIAVATLIPSIVAVYIGLFVAGLGISVMFPQLYDAAAKSEGAGRSLGALTAGSRISLLVAPAVVGLLADTDALTVGQAIAIITIPSALAVLLLTGTTVDRPADHERGRPGLT